MSRPRRRDLRDVLAVDPENQRPGIVMLSFPINMHAVSSVEESTPLPRGHRSLQNLFYGLAFERRARRYSRKVSNMARDSHVTRGCQGMHLSSRLSSASSGMTSPVRGMLRAISDAAS